MGTVFVDNLEPQSGTSLTLGASGDTVNLGSGGTVYNTPAFSASLSANQTSVSAGTFTKVQINSEDFDTDSAFDSSTNYRFTVPSGKAGKYLFTAAIACIDFSGSNSVKDIYVGAFYKNGSSVKAMESHNDAAVNGNGVSLSAIIDLSVSDYVELYIKADVGSGTGKIRGGSDNTTWFQGHRLIGA